MKLKQSTGRGVWASRLHDAMSWIDEWLGCTEAVDGFKSIESTLKHNLMKQRRRRYNSMEPHADNRFKFKTQ